ncbi:MAG: type II secretion system F family protein [Candidatus Altiarchaeota archaeon]
MAVKIISKSNGILDKKKEIPRNREVPNKQKTGKTKDSIMGGFQTLLWTYFDAALTLFEDAVMGLLELIGDVISYLSGLFASIPRFFFKLIVILSHRFMNIGKILTKFFPLLEKNLQYSELTKKYGFHATEYLTLTALAAIMVGAISAGTITVTYTYYGKSGQDIMLVIGALMGVLSFLFILNYPKMIISKRINDIDRHLLFALQSMQVLIQGGLPVFNSMVTIGMGQFGAISAEFQKITEKVKTGESMAGCVEDLAKRNPSQYFSRVCWQISNSLKSGSSLAEDLALAAEFLIQEQFIEIKRYGSQLNPLAMLYMMVAVIIPSLGITVLIVISSLPVSNLPITETTFWVLLFVTFILQLVFAGIIKSRRPSILGDSESTEEEKQFHSNFFKRKIYPLLHYNGIYVDLDKFLTMFITASMIFSYFVTIILSEYISSPSWMIFISVLFFLYFFIYNTLVLRLEHRAREMEKHVPDFLHMMSANIKAGESIHKAIFISTRPEYGRLNLEIERAGKEMLTGVSTKKALMDVASRYKSKNIRVAMQLILQGINSGGDLSAKLIQIATILRRRDLIQKELRASVLMYVSFIFFAIAIGAPLLFGVSSFLVDALSTSNQRIMSQMPQDVIAQRVSILSGLGSSSEINKDFIVKFSLISIVFSALMGSAIIGLINSGEAKNGIKYMPFMIAIPIILFMILQLTLSSTFESMISL